MYIFGGLGNNFKALNRLYCLNLVTNEWSQLNDHLTPNPRCWYTLIAMNHHIYIFGG